MGERHTPVFPCQSNRWKDNYRIGESYNVKDKNKTSLIQA